MQMLLERGGRHSSPEPRYDAACARRNVFCTNADVAKVHVLCGTIIVVQEQRIQLVDEEGIAHLLVLAHDIPLHPSDLRALQRSERRVRVEYRDCADLIAGIVTRIEPAEHNLEETRADERVNT
jgi:hypothetical protein